MTWDKESITDIDLYLGLPNKKVVFYAQKDVPPAILERDDLGITNDSYVLNGERILVKRNYEVINLTQLPDGDYYISGHYYASKFDGPLRVEFRILQLQPYKVIYSGARVFNESQEEIPVVSFVVENGIIKDVNDQTLMRLRPIVTYSQESVR